MAHDRVLLCSVRFALSRALTGQGGHQMSEEERSRALPQRERGATRVGAAPAAVPAGPQMLPEDLRKRMQAAVQAERAHGEAPAQEGAADQSGDSARRSRAANDGKAAAAAREGRTKQKQRARSRLPAKVRSAKAEQVVNPQSIDNPESPGTDGKRDIGPGAAEVSGTPDTSAGKVPGVRKEAVVLPLTRRADDVATDELAAINAQLAGHAIPSQPQPGGSAAASRPRAAEPPVVDQQPMVALVPQAARPARSRPVKEDKQTPKRALQAAKEKGASRRMMMAGLVVLALLVVTGGAATILVVIHKTNSPTTGTTPSAPVTQQQDAAQWVVAHVSRGVPVACDKEMCAALTANEFPLNELRELGPASSPPLTSAVVVETAAVRELFGTSLSSLYAPAVLAVFGSGETQINIRVVAPHGAAAYDRELAQDRTSRKAAEVALLGANQITVSPIAQTQLLAGDVDSRLLSALTSLAASLPIDIVDFENIGPGAGSDMPLRDADLATTDSAAHMSSAKYVQALEAQLSTGPGAHPASMMLGELPTGQILRVEFPAPSPLGLLLPQS
jgi:hypothetical protein